MAPSKNRYLGLNAVGGLSETYNLRFSRQNTTFKSVKFAPDFFIRASFRRPTLEPSSLVCS